MGRIDATDVVLVAGLLLLTAGLSLFDPRLALANLGGLLVIAVGLPMLRRL
jgi:hypothetical protein